MRVSEVTLTHVRVPMVEPFRISSGVAAEKDAIVARVRAGGLTGWGESSPMAGSFYSTDTPESCWKEMCEALAPAIVGREFTSPEEGARALEEIPASNFARAGLETALWDLEAQRLETPLHGLLGGVRERVESGLAVGLYDDIEQMLAAIERHLAEGYKRVKIKIERGRDVELVAAVRGRFGDIPLMVDANGAYSLRDLPVFRELDEFGLMMIEQPFPAKMLAETAQLQRWIHTPVCLDESLETGADLARALQFGSLRIANIKIQRVGGFAAAIRMAELCRAHSIPVWIGTMPELGIGQAQGAALASISACAFPTDVESSARWFRDDIVEPWIEVRDGWIALPQRPGLGYRVDEEKLARYAVTSRSFGEAA